jgi:Holliday junction resolvase RusA-like endonuclease
MPQSCAADFSGEQAMRTIAYLFIPGSLPGMNEIIDEARRNRFAAAKQKALWTGIVKMHALAAKTPAFKGADFTFEWRERTKRRNPDNLTAGMKFVFDGLQAAGVLENDGWGEVTGIAHRFVVNDGPGVLITIEGELR